MIWKIVGFIVGFGLAVSAEIGFLYMADLMPRGLGWLVLPFLAGGALASSAPTLVSRLGTTDVGFWQESRAFRAVVLLSTIWVLAVPAYWWLFEPYDYYMGDDDWLLMFKAMVFPVVILALGYFAYQKFVAPAPTQHQEKPLARDRTPESMAEVGLSRDQQELMERYGILYSAKKRYYEYGEFHFDRLADAIAHAEYMERRRSHASELSQ